MRADFDVVDTLWYIMGDESCGEVSSKSCVQFQRREQILIVGGSTPSPPIDPLDERRF